MLRDGMLIWVYVIPLTLLVAPFTLQAQPFPLFPLSRSDALESDNSVLTMADVYGRVDDSYPNHDDVSMYAMSTESMGLSHIAAAVNVIGVATCFTEPTIDVENVRSMVLVTKSLFQSAEYVPSLPPPSTFYPPPYVYAIANSSTEWNIEALPENPDIETGTLHVTLHMAAQSLNSDTAQPGSPFNEDFDLMWVRVYFEINEEESEVSSIHADYLGAAGWGVQWTSGTSTHWNYHGDPPPDVGNALYPNDFSKSIVGTHFIGAYWGPIYVESSVRTNGDVDAIPDGELAEHNLSASNVCTAAICVEANLEQ